MHGLDIDAFGYLLVPPLQELSTMTFIQSSIDHVGTSRLGYVLLDDITSMFIQYIHPRYLSVFCTLYIYMSSDQLLPPTKNNNSIPPRLPTPTCHPPTTNLKIGWTPTSLEVADLMFFTIPCSIREPAILWKKENAWVCVDYFLLAC